jgi:hypothetical protein
VHSRPFGRFLAADVVADAGRFEIVVQILDRDDDDKGCRAPCRLFRVNGSNGRALESRQPLFSVSCGRSQLSPPSRDLCAKLTGPITQSEYLTEVRRGQTSPVESPRRRRESPKKKKENA